MQVGRQAAAAILAKRRDDGASRAVGYAPGSKPGDYRPTPPDFTPAFLPQWGKVQPFVLKSSAQFRPAPPAPASRVRAPTSRRYGPSAARCPRSAPPSRARSHATGTRARRKAGTALPGKSPRLATWMSGKARASWRWCTSPWPTASSAASRRSTTTTTGARHCDHPQRRCQVAARSRHAARARLSVDAHGARRGRSRGAGALLRDRLRFVLDDERRTYAGITRKFWSFSEAARENGASRVLAGIHFTTAVRAGYEQGERIGAWTYDNALRPVRAD